MKCFLWSFQVYGAVTMNNTMCLGLFLLVMHIQRLPWTYSSEVLVTVGESFPCLLHCNHCRYEWCWVGPGTSLRNLVHSKTNCMCSEQA